MRSEQDLTPHEPVIDRFHVLESMRYGIKEQEETTAALFLNGDRCDKKGPQAHTFPFPLRRERGQ